MGDKMLFERRKVLAGLVTASIAGVVSKPMDVRAEQYVLNLEDPFAPMDLYALIKGTDSGQPAIWYSKSTYYGQLDNEAPIPILGAEALNLITVDYNGKGNLKETTERITYFFDLETGEVLPQWRNVFTGETIDIQKPRGITTTTIDKNLMRAEERSDYVDIDRMGRLHQPFLQGKILTIPHEQFATFEASALGDTRNRRAGQRWWSSILTSYSADVADIIDPTINFIQGHGVLFGSAPWYSWLRMGDRKGTSSVRRYLTKFPDVEALPSRLFYWLKVNHPDVLP